MTVEVVLEAMENTVEDQNPTPGLIPSFNRKGCPYDNACIESFHATLQKEEVYRTCYDSFETARVALFKYIEVWCNRSESMVASVI